MFMKKLFTYLFLTFFSILAPTFADDIRDLQIEGISIGDSLLDYLSKEEIIKELEITKSYYNYLNNDFGEVYSFNKFETYNHLSFKIKPKDKDYIIYSIKGSILYDDKLEQCFTKQKKIEKEFSSNYKNAKKINATHEFDWDPTGESVSHNIEFNLVSGGKISTNCTKYKKSLKIENGWSDTLQVIIDTKEVINWFNNPIN